MVKMAPSTQKVEKRISFSSQKNKGLIYVPRPQCLVNGTPDSVSSHSFSAKVWEVDASSGGPKFEWKGARAYGRLQLSRSIGNKWAVTYTFANPGDFKLDSDGVGAMQRQRRRRAEQPASRGLELAIVIRNPAQDRHPTIDLLQRHKAGDPVIHGEGR